MKRFDTKMPTRFSTKDVNTTAEKIYLSIAEKNTDEAYKHLASYFAEAKTKVIKQAVLKVRLKVLIARITALKLGIFSQKEISIGDLVSKVSKQNNDPDFLGAHESSADEEEDKTLVQVNDDTKEQLAPVSILEDVEVLGTSFTAGTIVEVPAKQLAELIDTGKAEIVNKKGKLTKETSTNQSKQGEKTEDIGKNKSDEKKQSQEPNNTHSDNTHSEKSEEQNKSEKVPQQSNPAVGSEVDEEEIAKVLEVSDVK